MGPSASERRALVAGARAVIPVLPGIVPFGMIVGLAMAAAGIPPELALLFSMIVYADASQLAASQLVPAGAPVLLILATRIGESIPPLFARPACDSGLPLITSPRALRPEHLAPAPGRLQSR